VQVKSNGVQKVFFLKLKDPIWITASSMNC